MISGGIVPVNPLYAIFLWKLIIIITVNSISTSLISYILLMELTYKVERYFLPREAGIVPLKEFRANETSIKNRHLRIDSGMVPVS
jgi:hypothetical protein